MAKGNCLGELSDEELVARCRENDDNAAAELIARFAPGVRKKADSFKGTMNDDLAQEGLLALLDAVRKYVPDKGAAFSTFAWHCIVNRMINVYKRVNTDFIELPDDIESAFDATVIPENIIVEQVSLSELYEKIEKTLSELELKVFKLYIAGEPYQTIAQRLDVPVKSVDNAVQRIKHKLKSVLR